MSKMTNAEVKRRYLKGLFGDNYDMWNNKGFANDKQLYCNIYEILLDALNAMEAVTNTLVWVGFNEIFNARCAMLNAIKLRFAGHYE